MESGLFAALSPNEEVALRRIAYGMVGSSDLKKQVVDHLTTLDLVHARGNALALTALGERRVAQLPNRSLGAAPLKDDAHVAALAAVLGIKR